jgi:hypothetical protein
MNAITRAASVTIQSVWYLYLASVMIAATYFNWKYEHEHSFAEWLMWGEVAPTAQAFAWPYFAFRADKIEPEIPLLTDKQTKTMNIRMVDRAIAAAGQATFLVNSREHDFLDSGEKEKVIAYEVQALRTADSTNEEILNELYPEFGTRFKRDFCGAQRLFAEGLRNSSRETLIKASELDVAWRDWSNANRGPINDAFTRAVQ